MKRIDFRLKRLLLRATLARKFTYRYQLARLQTILPRILPHLQSQRCTTILDLGPNTCVLAEWLVRKGFSVTGLDINNWSVSETFIPLLYDGGSFPFADQSFDFGLAISMLHHAEYPAHLLSELKRTCKFILIQEDLIVSKPRTYWTWILDSIVNLEIFAHPHSNKSDLEWKAIFAEAGLECIKSSYFKWQLVQFGVYLLKAR